MIDDNDKAALAALLTRYQRAVEDQTKFKKIANEATARHQKAAADIVKLTTAFSIFKFDVNHARTFGDIQEILGADEYSRAIAKAKGVTDPDRQLNFGPTHYPEEIDDLDEIKAKEVEKIDETLMPKIRELVLDQLKKAGEIGIKSSQIRYEIRSQDIEMHEKTVGMTLWRLSKDGLARLDKRTWFCVPPKAETENPGGDTPGPINEAD